MIPDFSGVITPVFSGECGDFFVKIQNISGKTDKMEYTENTLIQ